MREPFGRIDADPRLHARLLPFCRLRAGEIWEDPVSGHRVGILDACAADAVGRIADKAAPALCIADPPYNIAVGSRGSAVVGAMTPSAYEDFTDRWVSSVVGVLGACASFYAWIGADPKRGLHPLPEFVLAMRARSDWSLRNWITLRNQRGYGTQGNWMWVRQELLYYARGKPHFDVAAEYTDIPKILRGYYKDIAGARTENAARGKGETIRAGNVWVDIQQVFYRLHENVPGCYAQKPLKAIERIVRSATVSGDTVIDPFAHSGTTLIACEKLGRRAVTFDVDPVFAEITIRRLERFRQWGREGWQCESPFPELRID
jgi:site-specific DNA-methyltransferase (adenine-specific)